MSLTKWFNEDWRDISTKKVLDSIHISDKDISIDNIKKDNILNYSLELKKLDILFKKIENDN